MPNNYDFSRHRHDIGNSVHELGLILNDFPWKPRGLNDT